MIFSFDLLQRFKITIIYDSLYLYIQKLHKANEDIKYSATVSQEELDTWKDTCDRLTASVSRKESEIQALSEKCLDLEDLVCYLRNTGAQWKVSGSGGLGMLSQKYRRSVKSVWIWRTWYVIIRNTGAQWKVSGSWRLGVLSQKYRHSVKSVWIWKTRYVISEMQALSEKCLDLEDLLCYLRNTGAQWEVFGFGGLVVLSQKCRRSVRSVWIWRTCCVISEIHFNKSLPTFCIIISALDNTGMLSQKYWRSVKSVWIWMNWYVIFNASSDRR